MQKGCLERTEVVSFLTFALAYGWKQFVQRTTIRGTELTVFPAALLLLCDLFTNDVQIHLSRARPLQKKGKPLRELRRRPRDPLYGTRKVAKDFWCKVASAARSGPSAKGRCRHCSSWNSSGSAVSRVVFSSSTAGVVTSAERSTTWTERTSAVRPSPSRRGALPISRY